MPEFINTIDVLGDDVVLNSIIDNTIVEFKDDQLKNIGTYVFNHCTSLKVVDLPNVLTCAQDAFYNCTSLETVNMPLAGSGRNAFGNNVFQNCSSLKYVNLPVLASINSGVFTGCSSLKNLQLPSVATCTGHYTFQDCWSLETLALPSVKSISGTGFVTGCVSLKMLDLPVLTSISNSEVFIGCSSLDTILLRSEAGVVTLTKNGCFSGTPYTVGNGGYIYVPRSLISAYQTATNWSVLYALGKCEFLPIEDLTIDGSVLGELKKCKNIILNKTNVTFNSPGQQSLTATFTPSLPYADRIIWSSSDKRVAVVDDNGTVTAVGNGTATVSVTCGDISASCHISVSNITTPVPYWSLGGTTSFDGVKDYIDTEIALFSKPDDFTIITDIDYPNTHSANRIFGCVNNGGWLNRSVYGGVGMMCQNSNPIVTVCYRTANGLSGVWTSVRLSNWNNVSSVAIRFKSGAIDKIFYKDGSGTIVTVNPSGTPEYCTAAATLTIGATKNGDGSISGFYKTTINTFDIYSYALDDTVISNILRNL